MSEPILEAAARRVRGWMVFVGALLLALAMTLAVMALNGERRDAQIEGLTEGYEALRAQVESLGEEPVAPPPSVVIEDPENVTLTEVDSDLLITAAQDVLADVVPREVAEQIDDAVSTYIDGCVASGDCVGPSGAVGPTGTPGEAGPAGADGTDGTDGTDGITPSPGDVAAAVVAVCQQTLDCEATAEEIASAVASYCSGDGEPCGARWTEAEIYAIANRAIVDYTLGRPIWCPPEAEVDNGEPFGPCYLSVG